MPRPFLKLGIGELEAAFDRKRTDPDFLQKLIDELSHRSTGRADRLRAGAVQSLASLRKPNAPRSEQRATAGAAPTPDVSAGASRAQSSEKDSRTHEPMM